MVTPAQIIKRKRALRKYVIAHGGNPKGLNNAPIQGPVYRKWIKWLQRREWPKLPADGKANSRVLAVLFPPPKETFGMLALRVAKTQVGVKEHPAGSNTGPKVDIYERTCGIHAEPWCACFVTWCLRQVDWKETGWNQAYVPSWVATAHLAQHGLLTIPAAKLEPGDVVTFDWDDDGVADHIGFFDKWVVKGATFASVEGNTSPTNASNGGAVVHYGTEGFRPRSVSDVAAFIRVT